MKIAAVMISGLGVVCAGVWGAALLLARNPIEVEPKPFESTEYKAPPLPKGETIRKDLVDRFANAPTPKTIVEQAPEYSQASLNAAFLEVQQSIPGFPDAPETRSMVSDIAIAYCNGKRQGFPEEVLLNVALKSVAESDVTAVQQIMASALIGSSFYAAKTHVC